MVKLTVYYETLCPFSRLFILNQLEPNFWRFHDHLKLELVPYGIVKVIIISHLFTDFIRPSALKKYLLTFTENSKRRKDSRS